MPFSWSHGRDGPSEDVREVGLGFAHGWELGILMSIGHDGVGSTGSVLAAKRRGSVLEAGRKLYSPNTMSGCTVCASDAIALFFAGSQAR